jgi:polyisoprenoid-binding protein YceI
MKHSIWVTLLAASACLPACKSSEPPSTTTSAAQPAPTAPAAPAAKATDPASVANLALDPAASQFDFEAAKITRTHKGAFKRFSGSATLVADDLQSLAVEVETPSLEADDPKLAAHIKTADFLDVEKFPKATFKSRSIQKKPAGSATHEVTGELTLHGITQEVSFPATVGVTPTTVTASGTIRIDRQKFGVKYPGMPDDLIKDEVVLQPKLVFTRK